MDIENQIAESVIGFDALYDSMQKCVKGVLWKDSTASFYLRACENVERLTKELHNGRYKAKQPKHFMVTSPKPREIASIAFRDRVYQRSLNDNIVYPSVTNGFIYDNYACQKGKGTDSARERLKDFLRKCYRKNNAHFYVLQIDIKGYYPNMNHEKTEEMFKLYLDDWSYDKVCEILRGQYEGNKGYNPGSQLVQIAGIGMLNGLDHYIKEKLHIKYYIRYMDDLIVIHEDLRYLEECEKEIQRYLETLRFEMNHKKTRIYHISEGITFLGFTFSLTETGKVLMQITSENVKRQRKKLRRLVNKCLRGDLPRSSVDESYNAWRNYASKGNSYKLIQRMDKFYAKLWKEPNNGNNKETNDESEADGRD